MFSSLAGGIHAKLAGSSSDSRFVVFIEILKMSLNLGVRITYERVLYTVNTVIIYYIQENSRTTHDHLTRETLRSLNYICTYPKHITKIFSYASVLTYIIISKM